MKTKNIKFRLDDSLLFIYIEPKGELPSNTLLRTFSHCLTDVKVTLFQSYCTAVYCPFLWSDCKKSTFRKIRVALNNVYRKISGLPKRSSASVCST